MPLNFDELKSTYDSFKFPRVQIIALGANEVNVNDKIPEAVITDVDIDLSAGFESSIATFNIYNIYNKEKEEYVVDELFKAIEIGVTIKILLGYGSFIRPVFVGVINRISFAFEYPELPYIKVSAMDIKCVMMANNYSKQMTKDNWTDAVKEIFEKPVYVDLKNAGAITKLCIEQTADKKKAAKGGGDKKNPPPKIEMVAESDYEFVVKAAKKNNFEFFILNGDVIFRPAKIDKAVLMTLAPYNLLRDYEIEYDAAGQLASVEVRATDHEKAELITSKKDVKFNRGKKEGNLTKANTKVVLDSTVHSKEEADQRVESLIEESAFNYGKLSCEIVGIPDFVPGRFIAIAGLGTIADNFFYLTGVRHWLTKKGEYRVFLRGIAAERLKV